MSQQEATAAKPMPVRVVQTEIGPAKGAMRKSAAKGPTLHGSPQMDYGNLDAVSKGGVLPGASGATTGGGGERGGWGPFGSYSRSLNSDIAWAACFEQNARLSNPIQCLSTDVAKVKLVLRRDKGGPRELNPIVTSHPFLDLWNDPHPRLTQFQFLKITLEFLKTVGRCPWKFCNRKGAYIRGKHVKPPTGLEIIPPHFIQDYPTSTSPWVINWWSRGLEEVSISDVMFFFEPSLLDHYAPGIGLAKAIDENVNVDQAMGAFNSYYFRNMAFLGAILNIPGCDPDVEAAQFRQEKEGILNAFKTYITNSTGDVNVTNLSPSMKDLNFSEGTKNNRDLMNQRFNQSNARQGNFGENVTLGDLEAADYHQQHNNVVPELIYLAQAINKFLLPEWGEADLYAEFENPVKETAERTLAETKELMQCGLMLMNEGRRRHKLPEIEGANCFLIPTNNVLMVPADRMEEYIDLLREIAVAKLTNPNNQNEPKPAEPAPATAPKANGKASKELDLDVRLQEFRAFLAQPNGAN